VSSPFAIPNVRLFIAFRVFFSARFYYPVFTILFLDYGITLKQFALLNVVWAVTIVLLEVPSGALADVVGRKKLVVLAGILMVWEMALLCFAPRGNPDLLFAFFVLNRILSGTAEAAASGADEALAYDSLKEHGLVGEWGAVLEKQVRYQSIGFIIAMTTGAAVYDPNLVQKVADFFQLDLTVSQDVTLRLPILLTFLMSFFVLGTALRMEDIEVEGDRECSAIEGCRTSIASAFRLTFAAGIWIWKTPFAFVLIASGLFFDHVIRMVITLNSQYYRLIHLPEASFGLIGSGLAILGLVIPRLARKLTETLPPYSNFLLITGITLIGLFGVAAFFPYWGLVPVVLLISVMYFSSFFLSHYLNPLTESSQRATVLSFKGLSFNLAYGVIGALYSLLLSDLRPGILASNPGLSKNALENAVFVASMGWFPWYFIGMAFVLILFAKIRLGGSQEHKRIH